MLGFAAPMVAGAAAAKDPEGFAAKNMNMILMASFIPMILPLLTNPYIFAATAIGAVVGGIWMYKKKQDDAIREQARLVDEISATTEKMQKLVRLLAKWEHHK